jgi:hypothetical protein
MQHLRHTVTQFAVTALVTTLPFGCMSTETPEDGAGGTAGTGVAGSGAGTSAGQGGSSAGAGGGTSGSGGSVGKGGAGGAGGSAGAGAAGGSGGASGSSGASGTAGMPQAGAGSGGQANGGTAGTGDAGNAGSGARTGEGGAAGSAGSSGSAGTGAGTGGAGAGAGAGGTGSGECQKGTTMGNEVLFIGESFIAASSIPEETTKLARAAGSLGPSDSYVDRSVSGTWIGNGAGNSIPNQYRNNSDGVRFVLMNGGGNDCWQGGQESHRTAALNAAEELFQDMAENGVEKIVYFFYPDPIGNQYASLTACLDLLRPAMKDLCDSQTAPECYWVDLRETWDGHPEYTSDGIHVAGPGNVPTATAIFEAMEANCVAP